MKLIIVRNAEGFGLIGENSTKSLNAVSTTLLMFRRNRFTHRIRSSLNHGPDAMISVPSAMAPIPLDEVDFLKTCLTEDFRNSVRVFS